MREIKDDCLREKKMCSPVSNRMYGKLKKKNDKQEEEKNRSNKKNEGPKKN